MVCKSSTPVLYPGAENLSFRAGFSREESACDFSFLDPRVAWLGALVFLIRAYPRKSATKEARPATTHPPRCQRIRPALQRRVLKQRDRTTAGVF